MRIIIFPAFAFVFCVNVFSADKFEILAEIRIPSLMTSAQNLTLLSENVLPGTSGIIGVSVASLAFDPKLAGFDLTAPIQILGFGSKTAVPKELQWCLVMSPKNTNNPVAQINDRQRTVFVKVIGDRSVLSYNKTLVDSIIEIPATESEKDEYDVKIVLYPRKYLDFSPGGLASIKKEITESVLKKSGRGEEDLNNIKIFSIKMTELEKAVNQFSKTDFNINFHKDKLSINSEFLPVEGSSAESFIKAQAKTTNGSNACDTGTGILISFGRINITDQLKNEILETLKEILIETTDDYNPEITGFFSELAKSFSGDFRFRMDSFDPESVCCLETSVSNGKYQTLKNFISGRKTIKEVKSGIYSFSPENVDEEKYNSFINLNEKYSRIVYGKTSMSSVEKLITEGISSNPENQSKADISLYTFSNDDKNTRKPLFSSVFVFNGKTLTVNMEVLEECIKKAVPSNLIPKKPQGGLEKNE
jgi:hypothetical protein